MFMKKEPLLFATYDQIIAGLVTFWWHGNQSIFSMNGGGGGGFFSKTLQNSKVLGFFQGSFVHS